MHWLSAARPPYNSCKRLEILRRPTPVPRTVDTAGAMQFSTSSTSTLPRCSAPMRSAPCERRRAIPCTMAFSTNGWRIRAGTGMSRQLVSIRHSSCRRS
ncbi:hypothetical protein [Lysobacter gummosus]|uniref:hypothetical protein n=1 Tax=Lysobacter gummosus TaxID=262324 RepID=UPI003640C3C6